MRGGLPPERGNLARRGQHRPGRDDCPWNDPHPPQAGRGHDRSPRRPRGAGHGARRTGPSAARGRRQLGLGLPADRRAGCCEVPRRDRCRHNDAAAHSGCARRDPQSGRARVQLPEHVLAAARPRVRRRRPRPAPGLAVLRHAPQAALGAVHGRSRPHGHVGLSRSERGRHALRHAGVPARAEGRRLRRRLLRSRRGRASSRHAPQGGQHMHG